MFNDLDILLRIHVVAAVIAIVAGGIVFALPKGTIPHRRIATLYIAAMIVTSFVVIFVPATILRFGETGFGFFHLFIIASFGSGSVGLYALYRWRQTHDPDWLRVHQVRFAFSYAGLLMAGASQFATNPRFGLITTLTPTAFWLVFTTVNAIILGTAMFAVHRWINRGDPLRRLAMRT